MSDSWLYLAAYTSQCIVCNNLYIILDSIYIVNVMGNQILHTVIHEYALTKYSHHRKIWLYCYNTTAVTYSLGKQWQLITTISVIMMHLIILPPTDDSATFVGTGCLLRQKNLWMDGFYRSGTTVLGWKITDYNFESTCWGPGGRDVILKLN